MSSSSLGFGSCGNTGVTTGGVLSQLIALGAADVHLTAEPDVTFWRLRVNKSTNFAMEPIQQTFTGNVMWGQDVQITLNRTGDLIYWMYVVVDIPAIRAITRDSGAGAGGVCVNRFPFNDACDPCDDGEEELECADGVDDDELRDALGEAGDNPALDACTGLRRPWCNWVNEIGHAAVRRACFSIGGQVIDTVYSHYMHMWEELAGSPGKRLEEMVGKRFTRAQLVADSQRARRLYVPLPFYFTRHSGNALPLVSLQFHSVQVHVTFEQLTRLIQVSDCNVDVVKCQDGQPIANSDINAILDTTYIYLDVEERDRFALGSFHQLVTTIQQYNVLVSNTTHNAQLNFNHPTLELIWAAQRRCQSRANNFFNYSGLFGKDPIIRAGLRINNLPRFDREGQYFRLVQPWQHHTNIPRSFVYSYSFALHPEDADPTGSLNFSRIDNVEFRVDMDPDMQGEDTELFVFARSFNILRFREGLGGLAYAN